MAKIIAQPTIQLELTMSLTESEARALDALAGYGIDAFIKRFYDHLGRSYMEKHEAGLRSLLASIREIVPPHLSRVDAARDTFRKGSK